MYSNRNRKLQTSKAPLKTQEQGTSLFTSAASNQRVFPKNSPWEAQVRLPEGERMRLRVQVGLTVPPSPMYLCFRKIFERLSRKTSVNLASSDVLNERHRGIILPAICMSWRHGRSQTSPLTG